MPTTFTLFDKGEEIDFIGGDFKKRHGWLWKNKKQCKTMVYVIVDLGDGTEKGTRVSKKSVRIHKNDRPSTKIEAALRQFLEIEVEMNKLCKMLAQCGFQGTEDEIHDIITKKMEEAVEQHEAEGPKANTYKVNYEEDENEGMI